MQTGYFPESINGIQSRPLLQPRGRRGLSKAFLFKKSFECTLNGVKFLNSLESQQRIAMRVFDLFLRMSRGGAKLDRAAAILPFSGHRD